MRLSVTAVVISMLVACASLPKAAPERDAAAKRFDVGQDVARIYVYRLGSVFFARYDSWIRIADSYEGSISKDLFVYTDVAPGRHVVSATTIHVDGEGAREVASADLAVDADGGGIYFVRVEVPGRWPIDPPTIHLMERSEGMRAVERCQLAGVPR